MKLTKTLSIFIITAAVTLILCSCSTNTQRKGTSMADGARNAVRRSEQAINNGIGTMENGMNNMMGNGGYYTADGGYSAYNPGTSRTTLPYDGKATNILPTLRDTNRNNKGQINTNNGSSDGGMGDIYDDMNTSRNSIKTKSNKGK